MDQQDWIPSCIYSSINQPRPLKNILIVSGQNILLNRSNHSLQRLMSLTLSIIIFHILQRGESSLNRDIEALVPGIVERLTNSSGDDVRFSVLPST